VRRPPARRRPAAVPRRPRRRRGGLHPQSVDPLPLAAEFATAAFTATVATAAVASAAFQDTGRGGTPTLFGFEQQGFARQAQLKGRQGKRGRGAVKFLAKALQDFGEQGPLLGRGGGLLHGGGQSLMQAVETVLMNGSI
jgi:hypothetical protein